MSQLQTFILSTENPRPRTHEGVAQLAPNPHRNIKGQTLKDGLRADRCRRVVDAVRREQRFLGATWATAMGLGLFLAAAFVVAARDEEAVAIAVVFLGLTAIPAALALIVGFATAHGRAYAEARELQDRITFGDG